MKLQQLRYISEVVKQDLNVSEAAQALHTSQPGVSKQIRLLEEELGVPIFLRTGKSLAQITEPGREILKRSNRILLEVDMIRRIGEEYTRHAEGTLTVATTHTQACYALPPVITAFLERYPNVKLHIRQGSPQNIADMVASEQADVGIATETVSSSESLIALPCYHWSHCVIVPKSHPLKNLKKPLSLAELASHPLITYDFAFAGRSLVNKAFAKTKLTPNVVLTALDSDVIKTYVRAGLGVGLLAQMAFDKNKDKDLHMIDAAHLFAPNTTWIGVRRGSYMRGFVYDFIELFAPHLNRKKVAAALNVE
ncbi:MAG: HTH-type transcriptional regulator CysB [Gammaproteobacteria bacterium]|jgi:LysR family cys regulon transcriptional activator|nr:HTH-type transcriptional regulator CysB [Gammaproteobacteria bacterium]